LLAVLGQLDFASQEHEDRYDFSPGVY
jgi:hypothetical protein